MLELLLLLLSWAVLTKLIRIRNQLISPMVQQPGTSRTGYVPPTPLLDNIPEENRGTAKLLLNTQAREDSDAPNDAANNSLSAKTGFTTWNQPKHLTLNHTPSGQTGQYPCPGGVDETQMSGLESSGALRGADRMLIS